MKRHKRPQNCDSIDNYAHGEWTLKFGPSWIMFLNLHGDLEMQKMQNTAKIKTCRTGTTERATLQQQQQQQRVCKKGIKRNERPAERCVRGNKLESQDDPWEQTGRKKITDLLILNPWDRRGPQAKNRHAPSISRNYRIFASHEIPVTEWLFKTKQKKQLSIKMGSDESRFKVELTAKGKITRQCPHWSHTFWRES